MRSQNGWQLMTFQVWHKTSDFLMMRDLIVTYVSANDNCHVG